MPTIRFPLGRAAAGRGGPGALPGRLAQPWLDLLVAAVTRRHAGLLDRLAALDGKSLRIEPSDLPIAFLVTFAGSKPRARLVTATHAAPPDATIRAPLHVLLDIAEGRVDGDGLFFGRAVTVAGDTGMIVALRNALDDAEIDFAADLASAAVALPPFLRSRLSGGIRFGRNLVAALSQRLAAAGEPRHA